MRLKSRIIKNINFHELISSNDINISAFNIAKYTNRRNIRIEIIIKLNLMIVSIIPNINKKNY